MKKIIISIILLSSSYNLISQQDSSYIYTPNDQNVVASAIEGIWQPDGEMDNKIKEVSFKKDISILDILPKKYYEYLKGKPIYFAGQLTFKRGVKKHKFPCVLITHHGNPHIVFFRDRDGETLGDAESFNLFIARKRDKKDDILFIGGDFNGEPFVSYKRVK